MDLDYSAKQVMLRRSAADFLARECPFDEVRRLEESVEGYNPATWKKMARLGWLELFYPEDCGGLGDPFAEVAILLEEMGKRAFPSPFFTTVIQAGLILLAGGSDTQKKSILPLIAAGNHIIALAQFEADAGYSPESITLTATADGAGWRLNGTKLFVLDANIADQLIVVARTEQGITLFLTDTNREGITIQKLQTIGKDNQCQVRFADVPVGRDDLIGAAGEGRQILETAMPKAVLAKCAEMLGGCQEVLKMTTAYAKQRVQYERPIGAFQVIQHYLADMKIACDTTLYYYHQVIWLVDQGMAVALPLSALKARCNQVYKTITDRAVQIFGGVGTTREFNIGLFFRRAKVAESVLGDTHFHHGRIAEALQLDPETNPGFH